MATPSKIEEAFLAAYEEHADGLFRFCLSRVNDRERALDLTQEVFTKTWDYVREGGSVDSWKAFLYRAAHNAIVDFYRKKKNVSLDVLEEDGFEAATPSTQQNNAEFAHIRATLDSLDDTYRIPLTLRFIEGLNPAEIAQILSLTPNVVSVRINRGLAQLREKLHVI